MATTTKSRSTTRVAKKIKDRVHIVGFAPSWTETPWDDADAERWGLNSLHKMSGDRPFDRWYQLHDIETTHKDDGHLEWLRLQKMPIVMWEEHIEKYEIPTGIPYPKKQILKHFGGYFTNSISWMIAHAVYQKYSEIGVYGVDMATDSEYGGQRPSCEFFLGWAQGAGIDIHIPTTSDLLKTPVLYGIEDGGPLRAKMVARLTDLRKRQNEVQQQLNQGQVALHQLSGAIEDTEYYLRAWSPLDGGGAPSNNGGPPDA